MLIHADDTTILAGSRESAERKIRSLMYFCRINHISLQITKCEFIVINGDSDDRHSRQPLCFGNEKIDSVPFIRLLGSHLSESGSLDEDLKLHMTKRYIAVHKFYNFLRENKLAPVLAKLNVLRACVTSSLLHNCEAFGDKIPKQLESTYFALIKSCLGVRSNTPNNLVLIESGMPSLEAMIYARQFNFHKKFLDNLQNDSPRKTVSVSILETNCDYLKHYENLCSNFASKNGNKKSFI